MIIKVCGIKEKENLRAICELNIDMVGFNFYPPSSRFTADVSLSGLVPDHIKKVGVFVNASYNEIMAKARDFDLDYAQLHGDETDDFCASIQERVSVIKALPIKEKEDLAVISNYQHIDFFLFDTKVKSYGGSGHKWDWSFLEGAKSSTPFLMAGGIGPKDVEKIQTIKHVDFNGVDINSRFEISPGLKDVDKIKTFAEAIKNKSVES